MIVEVKLTLQVLQLWVKAYLTSSMIMELVAYLISSLIVEVKANLTTSIIVEVMAYLVNLLFTLQVHRL